MRIHAEAEVRLPRPVFQIVPRSESLSSEVGDLILRDSSRVQSLTCHGIEIRNCIVMRDKMRMITRSSGDQLATEPRVFIHLEHVNAHMRNTGRHGFLQRQPPALATLMRQTSDQINVEVTDSCRSQTSDVVEHRRSIVQTSDG